MQNNLINAVHKTIEKHCMLKKNDSVLVSVSGGPDSVFLLHCLKELAPCYGLGLHVFHLDHLTRGGDSGRDALFVKAMCQREGLSLELQRIDAQAWAQKRGLSFQEGARVLRLRLLKETAKKHGLEKIALGHQADDSIETFFLNLLRGSGISGLGAIKPVSGCIIRPLVEIYRQQILDYLKDGKIAYRTDHTNLEHTYTRNRVRNLLFPLLEKEFGPDFKKNIYTLTRIARDEDIFMRRLAREAIDKNCKKIDLRGKTILLKMDISFLEGLDNALARRVLREAIIRVKGHSRDITSKNIEDMRNLGHMGGEAKKIQPRSDVLVVKEKKYLYFIDLEKKKNLPVEYKAFFTKEGPTEKSLNIGETRFYRSFNLYVFSDIREPIPNDYKKASPMEAFLDYDKISFPVKIRAWQEGDTFFPLGTGGEKKLQDLFTDQKIPRHKRSLTPIFTDRQKIIWVGGLRIDERVKVRPVTKKILYIKIFKKRPDVYV